MPDREYSSVAGPRDLVFVAASRQDLSAFPAEVKGTIGFALRMAQNGLKHDDAKPLKGYKGAGVLEIIKDHDGDTFRAVYTVRMADRVYVLHAFQKKSKKGTRTPKHETDLIKARLRDAEHMHRAWLAERGEA